MSFEKVTIKDVFTVKGKDEQEHKLLKVVVLQEFDVYLNKQMQANMPVYRSSKGKTVLIPGEWTTRNGKPNLNLAGDGLPIPVPDVGDEVVFDTTTGEILQPAEAAKPMPFGNFKKTGT